MKTENGEEKDSDKQPPVFTVEKKRFRRRPSATLKQKITVPLILETLLSCVLMLVVSYNAIYTLQQDKIKTAMTYDTHRISADLYQSYIRLFQMSQQMSPEGDIGSMVDQYFTTTENYNKYVLSKEIEQNIGMVAFSNPEMELEMYCEPKQQTAHFANLPLRNGFSLTRLPELGGKCAIEYQPPHLTGCGCSQDMVISVTRAETFSNNQQWMIYLEAKTDITNQISGLSGEKNLNYELLMLDGNNAVRYSSIPHIFPTGSNFQTVTNDGNTKGYIWASEAMPIGFRIVLLMPNENYNRELYIWEGNGSLIAALGICTVIFIGIMLTKSIYKPIQQFSLEMKDLGQGNMGRNKYHTGIEEFDHLFETFNEMKDQIEQLAVENKRRETEKHQIEMENLTYKINPHFLMNTLNSVHWLAVMHGQKEIDRFVSTLNRLLCYNLGKDHKIATLRTEVDVVRSYVELQQMRYDFNASFDIEEGEYLDRPIARFILQPIVENAICHGLDEDGTVWVTIRPDFRNGKIVVTVRDNGNGMNQKELELLRTPEQGGSYDMKKGIGLRYVDFALKSNYGDKAAMEIVSAEHKGTTVKIYLPL